MQISAPTNFDFNIIKRLKNIAHDTYGSLNNGVKETIVPTYALPVISMEKLKQYVEYSHTVGIKFNYIMNHIDLPLDRERIAFLDRLNKINVDIITASDPRLIVFLKKEYPFQVCTSVACKINSIEHAIEYRNLGCDILCLDCSKNTDLQFIKLVKRETRAKIKVLANNICLPNCPFAEDHFKDGEYLERGPLRCLEAKLNDISLIKKTGFIHPNDTKKYEEAGVDFLKLGGRTKPTWWIINCVMAYYKNNYKRNSFRLMNTSASENMCPPIVRNFLVSLPDFFIRRSLVFLYFLTNRRIFRLLSKEKNIKSLLRLYLTRDFFYMDDKEILINRKKKEYLLKEINKILK